VALCVWAALVWLRQLNQMRPAWQMQQAISWLRFSLGRRESNPSGLASLAVKREMESGVTRFAGFCLKGVLACLVLSGIHVVSQNRHLGQEGAFPSHRSG
jgi:hypothetical protein